MGVISWIILGIAAGGVTSYFTDRTDQNGYLINILIGVVGACAGGFSANLVMRLPPLGFSMSSFIVAILGAAIFLIFANSMKRT
jgi:uncharacterized membrane protein YeaQ/YmgE (transglycosylase-associated protein family)